MKSLAALFLVALFAIQPLSAEPPQGCLRVTKLDSGKSLIPMRDVQGTCPEKSLGGCIDTMLKVDVLNLCDSDIRIKVDAGVQVYFCDPQSPGLE